MAPTELPCPWCFASQRVANNLCTACSGTLPPAPREGPPPAPPPAPRGIPAAFRARCLRWNDYLLGGLLLGGPGCAFLIAGVLPLVFGGAEAWTTGAIFLAMGVVCLVVSAPLLRVGQLRLRARRAVFEHGEAVSARIVSIAALTSVIEENAPEHLRHPWQVEYVFEAGGAARTETRRVDPNLWHNERRAGDTLWLLLHPGYPSQREFWPPLDS